MVPISPKNPSIEDLKLANISLYLISSSDDSIFFILRIGQQKFLSFKLFSSTICFINSLYLPSTAILSYFYILSCILNFLSITPSVLFLHGADSDMNIHSYQCILVYEIQIS